MRAIFLALSLGLMSASNAANAGGLLSRILDPQADIKEQIDQARAEQEAKDRERQARIDEERKQQPPVEQASANPCQLGGKLAYDAYLEATYDAKFPDKRRLHYTVDYLGDMIVVKHERKVAHEGVDYIADRLQPTGMRKPWDGAVYEAAREFIVNKCSSATARRESNAVPVASSSPPKDVALLIAQAETLNDKCRGGSGDDPATEKACGERDAIFRKKKEKNWCWGHDDQIGADRTWERCRSK